MTEIDEIKERNRRVELDKAWETSGTRRSAIACVTYLAACSFLIAIGNEKPFLNALVPVSGYVLSTLSLPFLKSWWIKRQNHD